MGPNVHKKGEAQISLECRVKLRLDFALQTFDRFVDHKATSHQNIIIQHGSAGTLASWFYI